MNVRSVWGQGALGIQQATGAWSCSEGRMGRHACMPRDVLLTTCQSEHGRMTMRGCRCEIRVWGGVWGGVCAGSDHGFRVCVEVCVCRCALGLVLLPCPERLEVNADRIARSPCHSGDDVDAPQPRRSPIRASSPGRGPGVTPPKAGPADAYMHTWHMSFSTSTGT